MREMSSISESWGTTRRATGPSGKRAQKGVREHSTCARRPEAERARQSTRPPRAQCPTQPHAEGRRPVTDALEDRDLNAVARNRLSSDHLVWTEPYPRRVRAFLDGIAVVDSSRALLLLEARHLPVYYFPPEDVRTELLEPTDTSTHCPHKGHASYWSVRAGDRVAQDAVWSYQDPLPGRTDIKGYLAFYWNQTDAWFEEDDEVFVPPPRPLPPGGRAQQLQARAGRGRRPDPGQDRPAVAA